MRIVPWITDGSLEFIDGWLDHRGTHSEARTVVHEFGSGSSTLYFLSRGCVVYSVDHEPAWTSRVIAASEAFELDESLTAITLPRPYDQALTSVGSCDILFIDGRDRVACLDAQLPNLAHDGLVVVDNTERLEAHYSPMFELLANFELIHFEQPSHRWNGPRVNYRDRAGDIVDHRWITTCGWRRSDSPRTTQGTVVARRSVPADAPR